jgi:uncharacterized Ntn-hydrolase superfamily protein
LQTIAAANQTALEARGLLPRDFLWITARVRATSADYSEGYWSDAGTISAAVYNPDTSLEETRSWKGAGQLIEIGPIARVSNLTVQNVDITFNHLDDSINDLHRLYDLRQAKIEIYRGYLDPDTRQLVAAAEPRFLGFVDEAENTTPAEGGEGSFVIKCVSHTQEFTRSNHEKRSDASQKLRSATDNFYQDTATVGEWELFWGKNTVKAS